MVDRILDLASATKCSSENLFDRLLHTLKRLHEYSNDVAINMTNKSAGDLTAAHGCLAPQTEWNNGWKMMEHLFYDNSPKAVDLFTEEIREVLQDSTDHLLADIINRCSRDWEFIEKFTHLYQVNLYFLSLINVHFIFVKNLIFRL